MFEFGSGSTPDWFFAIAIAVILALIVIIKWVTR